LTGDEFNTRLQDLMAPQMFVIGRGGEEAEDNLSSLVCALSVALAAYCRTNPEKLDEMCISMEFRLRDMARSFQEVLSKN